MFAKAALNATRRSFALGDNGQDPHGLFVAARLYIAHGGSEGALQLLTEVRAPEERGVGRQRGWHHWSWVCGRFTWRSAMF
jgi:hypothetical protein